MKKPASPKSVLRLTKETVKNLRVSSGVKTGGTVNTILPGRCAQTGIDCSGTIN